MDKVCIGCLSIITDSNRYVGNGIVHEHCCTCIIEDDSSLYDLANRLDRVVKNLIPVVGLIGQVKDTADQAIRNVRALTER